MTQKQQAHLHLIIENGGSMSLLKGLKSQQNKELHVRWLKPTAKDTALMIIVKYPLPSHLCDGHYTTQNFMATEIQRIKTSQTIT